jgi:hypothetical protein
MQPFSKWMINLPSTLATRALINQTIHAGDG